MNEKKVLSIDGGGIKTYYSLVILEELENKDKEIDRISRENANLVEIKRKLENAVIQQNELMNDLRKQMILQRENEIKESSKETITRVDRVTKTKLNFRIVFNK